jgi:hypothetical protein
MPTFEPPTTGTDTPIFERGTPERKRNPLGNALMKFFPGPVIGRNVYVLADGTITEDEPAEGDITAAKVYHFGHVHTVTEEEADALRGAGYSVSD